MTATLRQFNLGKSLKAAVSVFILIMAIGCKRNDAEITIYSKVMIINAWTDEGPLDFYLDEVKMNAQPLAFADTLGYFITEATNRKMSLRNSGTSNIVISDNFDFEAGKTYSIFFQKRDMSTTKPDTSALISIIEDDLSLPSSGQAKIRFLNLVNTDSLKISINSRKDSLNATSDTLALKYKEPTHFVSPYVGISTFKIFSKDKLVDSINVSRLKDQKIYTICLFDPPGDVKYQPKFIINR